MWHSHTFWRFFLSSAVLIVAALGLLGFFIVNRVEEHSLAQLEGTLRARATLLRPLVRDQRSQGQLQEQIAGLGHDIKTRITLIAADGTVLADSNEDPARMENHGDRAEVRSARDDGCGTSTRQSATLGMPMMYLAMRVGDPSTENGKTRVAYIRVALSLHDVQEQLAWYHRLVWTAALATAAVALLIALWLARRISRPIQELTEGAERIAAGGYGHKVYAVGQDEIAALGRAFNAMSEHLEEQFMQLAEDRQQLRMILSGMVEGVVALDAQQRVVFANERAADLLGFPGRSVVGRPLWEAARRSGLRDVVQRALAESEPSKQELNWQGATAQRVTVHAARLEGSPPRGVVLVLHDTTELRRLERLRQDFVANVSHELKTPLSIIKACVETLLEGAADDPEHRGPFLQRIAEQSDRLHALILDLLSLARIEGGTEAFEFESVPLAEVVARCLERHRARAAAKKQLLEVGSPCTDKESRRHGDKEMEGALASPCPLVSVSPCLPVTAWADQEAVQEILDNLVDNAVKYTPEGGRIRVGWQAENGEVCLQVEDSGIGIPEHDLPRIFERFYRVDKARSRELGGTGLGLSIVKHLAQAMHGSVGVTSQVGRGTTFTVRLPAAPVA
jgi:two-component system phosphate regulon sensor histidine kinase PhoR